MAKQEFKIKELYALQDEINVILGEKLTILTRYKFSDLKKTVDALVATATEMKDELIKTHGTTDEEGNVQLKVFKDEATKELTPEFKAFQNEWLAILETEKELTYSPIALSMIEKIETEKNIEIVFRLLEGALKAAEKPKE